jgi:hypothetical protein
MNQQQSNQVSSQGTAASESWASLSRMPYATTESAAWQLARSDAANLDYAMQA